MPETSIRDLDGEPHDVAYIAGTRLQDAIHAAQRAASDLHWAARNAWLTAEDVRTGSMPPGDDFEDTAQGTYMDHVRTDLETAMTAARVLTQAASHDPRAR